MMVAVSVVGAVLAIRERRVRQYEEQLAAASQFGYSGGDLCYGCTFTDLGEWNWLTSGHNEPDCDDWTWWEFVVGPGCKLAPEGAAYPASYRVSGPGGLFQPGPKERGPTSVGTDAGLRLLQCFPTLKVVSTGVSERVTDVGLQCIAYLPQLEALALERSQITDSGLAVLRRCVALKFLNISYTRVTDAGVQSLSSISGLRVLDLDGTRITDDGTRFLVPLQGLAKLHLQRTQISDNGLRNIASLRGLQFLDIRDTKVSDAGLDQLKATVCLREILAARTLVSTAGAKHLEALLPGVRIKLDDATGPVKPPN